MRIKIEAEGKELYYAFYRLEEISIGRSPGNTIQIVAEGVSRKHIVLETHGSDIYLKDVGSSQGTFVNGDKLLAGQVIEFNSFFPAIMGGATTLSLLDDYVEIPDGYEVIELDQPAASIEEITESKTLNTVVTSLDSIDSFKNKKKTSGGVAAELLFTEEIRSAKKEKPRRLRIIHLISIFLILGLIVAGFLMLKILKQDAANKKAKIEVEKEKLSNDETTVEGENRKEEKIIIPPSRTEMNELIKDKLLLEKCLAPEERELCRSIRAMGGRSYSEGIIFSGKYLYIFWEKSKLMGMFNGSPNYTANDLKEVRRLMKVNKIQKSVVQKGKSLYRFKTPEMNRKLVYSSLIHFLSSNVKAERIEKLDGVILTTIQIGESGLAELDKTYFVESEFLIRLLKKKTKKMPLGLKVYLYSGLDPYKDLRL